MKKVLKVRYDGQRVVFENIIDAVEFLNSLGIPKDEMEVENTEMSDEEFDALEESKGF